MRGGCLRSRPSATAARTKTADVTTATKSTTRTSQARLSSCFRHRQATQAHHLWPLRAYHLCHHRTMCTTCQHVRKHGSRFAPAPARCASAHVRIRMWLCANVRAIWTNAFSHTSSLLWVVVCDCNATCIQWVATPPTHVRRCACATGVLQIKFFYEQIELREGVPQFPTPPPPAPPPPAPDSSLESPLPAPPPSPPPPPPGTPPPDPSPPPPSLSQGGGGSSSPSGPFPHSSVNTGCPRTLTPCDWP